MKLKDLLARCGYGTAADWADVEITDIVIDSRKVKPGALFVCIPGTKVDGHLYAGQAVASGAAALVVEHTVEGVEAPQIPVADCREALARLAAAFHGNPAERLSIIGVTGTNGKTTTTYLLKSIFETAGEKVGLLGTIATLVGDRVLPQALTTPDPMDFHAALKAMEDAGCTRVVMEVSAHALALRKVAGIRFDAAIYTNLTQDHLDDFHTMENYRAAKKKLFTPEAARAIVLNCDDPNCAFMAEGFTGPQSTYGSGTGAALRCVQKDVRPDGASFTVAYKGTKTPVELHLPGEFNVYNAMGAIGAALAVGIPMAAVVEGLEHVRSMNGRMERVETGREFTVIVDYAHTPDSLENMLHAARGFTPGRVLVVFGCGGDRDRTKRPIMGRLATSLADYAILTSDNPRTEDPDSIIGMIEPGAREGGGAYERITDRRAAIGRAIGMAKPGDVVIIAGKGHETYQDVMGVKHHFDDREVAREFLAALPTQPKGN